MEGKTKNWMFRLSKACAILHHLIVLKLELSRKAKLWMFKSIFAPFLTYGLECWVTAERGRSQMQASERGFLRKIKRFRHLTNLTLRSKISQHRVVFGSEDFNLGSLPEERLPKQTLYAKMSGKRPVGRPRTRWLDYFKDLAWNRL